MQLRVLTLIGIIISIVTGVTGGVLWHQRSNTEAESSAAMLNSALRQIRDNYVEEVSDETLIDFAINGMVQGLDEHSGYLDRSQFRALEANTTGRFGGIGIELGLVDDYFTVIAPLDDTPAARAGVRAGDRITALDGESLRNKKLNDVIRTLRGEPGTEVTLRIRREDQPRPLSFNLVREDISVSSVNSRVLSPGYGYLRISQFQTNTAEDLQRAVTRLQDDNPDLQGVVLDLRNNPGGTLLSSVEVVDLFLHQGVIVSTRGRLKSSATKYRATRGDALEGAPMVIIINGGSASASEVVAGALQDHDRATLIGSKSYGKGSVQSVVPLNDDQALKITTAHYFTPLGRNIHQTGIEPDVVLSLSEEDLLSAAVDLLKAAQLEPTQLRAELVE